jgi:hypothetical protein
MRFVRARDDRFWRAGGLAGLPRPLANLEGHGPRSPCCTRDSNGVETFVPAAGEAAGPPIIAPIIMRFVRARDDRFWMAGGLAGLPRLLANLEGHGSRCPCCTRDINSAETFVPTAGEAAGPPIIAPIIMRFVRARDDRFWRAGGLAGLPRLLTNLEGHGSRCRPRCKSVHLVLTSETICFNSNSCKHTLFARLIGCSKSVEVSCLFNLRSRPKLG